MRSLTQLLDPEQKVKIEEADKENFPPRGELAEVQVRIAKGLQCLEAHFAKEPPKSDRKYNAWEITALKLLARYHDLVEREKVLLAK